MPRRTFALWLTCYGLLRLRNILQRGLLAHGRYRAHRAAGMYPRTWTHE